MTNQGAFTKVVQHLRTQGIPSRNKSGCLYRHPDGIRRCAVGVLIPDNEYNPYMEYKTVGGLGGIPSLAGLDASLLYSLQAAHDKSPTSQSWLDHMEERYIKIALDFHLQVPPHPCTEEPIHESNQSSGKSETHMLTCQA